jgi:hypothetical protein
LAKTLQGNCGNAPIIWTNHWQMRKLQKVHQQYIFHPIKLADFLSNFKQYKCQCQGRKDKPKAGQGRNAVA